MTGKKEVECVDIHTRIMVDIRNGEHIPDVAGIDHQPRLLLDLPHHALFGILVVIHETAWQVEGAFGWFFSPTGHQQLTSSVEDKGGRRGSGILIIRESAVSTVPAQGIMDW